MKIERTKNATKNIIFGTILKIYQIIGPFLMRTLMIYYLGVEYLGLNSLFTSVLQVLNLAELGVGAAMVFSMYKPIAKDNNEELCALMRLYKIYYRVIGTVILILGLALCPFIPYLIKSDLPPDINIYILYLINLLATVFSYWMFAYKNSLLQAYQRVDVISKITIAINTIMYVLQAIVLIAFRNYYYYIMLTLFAQIAINIVTAIVSSKMYPQLAPKGKLSKVKRKKVNQRIKDLFITKIGTVAVNSADTIIISAFLGLTQLAIYQNYYYIVNAVYGIIVVIFNSVLAGIGNSLITESKEKNYEDLKKLTFITQWICCICICCFICLYQPFMKTWVGEGLMLQDNYVIFFCMLFYVLVLPMMWATIKDAAGLWHYDRFRPFFTGIANLILNIILVKFIGLYGIIVSTVLSEIFIAVPWVLHNLFKYVYKCSVTKYCLQLIKHLICIVCCAVVSAKCCILIKIDGIYAIVVYALICFIISNVIQYICFHKSEEFSLAKDLAFRMLKLRREEKE